MLNIPREPYVKQSISFRRSQLAAAKQIAIDDGHTNLSRVIQELLETELKRRYGRDWADAFTIAHEESGVAA